MKSELWVSMSEMRTDKGVAEIFITAVWRRPRPSLQSVRIRINRCTIFESNFICPSFSPWVPSRIPFYCGQQASSGGKKDPTRHTKRLIFDLRFCPRSPAYINRVGASSRLCQKYCSWLKECAILCDTIEWRVLSCASERKSAQDCP